MNLILTSIAVGLLIASAETAQGILRVRYLNRPLGDHRARQVGVAIASAIILAIAWVTVPWLGVQSEAEAWLAGGIWLTLMLSYDLGLGRIVFHVPWPRLRAEFDVRKGGLLGFGMLVLLVAPFLVVKLRGLIP